MPPAAAAAHRSSREPPPLSRTFARVYEKAFGVLPEALAAVSSTLEETAAAAAGQTKIEVQSHADAVREI